MAMLSNNALVYEMNALTNSFETSLLPSSLIGSYQGLACAAQCWVLCSPPNETTLINTRGLELCRPEPWNSKPDSN